MPTAQDQQAYNLIVKQVLSFAAKNGQQLEQMVKQVGPVKGAIVFIQTAMKGVGNAAKSSGVNVKGETIAAALKEIVVMLVATMKAGGLVQDIPGTVKEILGGLQNGTA